MRRAPDAGKAGNLHATALVAGDRGILVTGPSGAGKTTLALALTDAFGGRGRFARLVADDQVLVRAVGGRVVAEAPATIEGLAEVAGIGPRPVAFERSAVIDLVLELSPEPVERFQPDTTVAVAGCPLPRLVAPARNVGAALAIVRSVLGAGAERD